MGITSTYEEQLAKEIKETPEEYLPNLLQIVRLFRESVALKPAEVSFRQGWREALAGETQPLAGCRRDQWMGKAQLPRRRFCLVLRMGKAQLPRRRFCLVLPETAGRGSPASFTPTAC